MRLNFFGSINKFMPCNSLKIFLGSRAKLQKLATKFVSKAKSKYNKAFDNTKSIQFSSLDYNTNKPFDTHSSLRTKEDLLIDIHNDTYDLEKLKAEEANYKPVNTLGNSRYKKVYKSFRSAIKRNSSSSYTDLNNNNTKQLTSNDFDVFQNEYSYNDSNQEIELDIFNNNSYPYNKAIPKK